MYAVIAETAETIADSSLDPVAGDGVVSDVEARFIENWAKLSTAFGMGEDAGRVHAAIYLSDSPLTMAHVAVRIGLSVAETADAIETLLDYAAIRAHGERGSATAYVSEADPWTWFMSTIRRRASLEFMPLMRAIRDVGTEAAKAQRAGKMSPERLDRITRFGGFVDQVSGMLETLGSVGNGSMFSAVRTLSRFLPR